MSLRVDCTGIRCHNNVEHRSVTGPLSAAFARDMRVGDSGCGALKPRFLEIAT